MECVLIKYRLIIRLPPYLKFYLILLRKLGRHWGLITMEMISIAM